MFLSRAIVLVVLALPVLVVFGLGMMTGMWLCGS